EAAEIGAFDKLANLCAIVDVNGLGQSGKTMHGHDIDAICAKWRAFGWNAIGLDGHDVAALARAFDDARKTADRPTVLVARTLKGGRATGRTGGAGGAGRKGGGRRARARPPARAPRRSGSPSRRARAARPAPARERRPRPRRRRPTRSATTSRRARPGARR